jgi:hypothetical protein
MAPKTRAERRQQASEICRLQTFFDSLPSINVLNESKDTRKLQEKYDNRDSKQRMYQAQVTQGNVAPPDESTRSSMMDSRKIYNKHKQALAHLRAYNELMNNFESEYEPDDIRAAGEQCNYKTPTQLRATYESAWDEVLDNFATNLSSQFVPAFMFQEQYKTQLDLHNKYFEKVMANEEETCQSYTLAQKVQLLLSSPSLRATTEAEREQALEVQASDEYSCAIRALLQYHAASQATPNITHQLPFSDWLDIKGYGEPFSDSTPEQVYDAAALVFQNKKIASVVIPRSDADSAQVYHEGVMTTIFNSIRLQLETPIEAVASDTIYDLFFCNAVANVPGLRWQTVTESVCTSPLNISTYIVKSLSAFNAHEHLLSSYKRKLISSLSYVGNIAAMHTLILLTLCQLYQKYKFVHGYLVPSSIRVYTDTNNNIQQIMLQHFFMSRVTISSKGGSNTVRPFITTILNKRSVVRDLLFIDKQDPENINVLKKYKVTYDDVMQWFDALVLLLTMIKTFGGKDEESKSYLSSWYGACVKGFPDELLRVKDRYMTVAELFDAPITWVSYIKQIEWENCQDYFDHIYDHYENALSVAVERSNLDRKDCMKKENYKYPVCHEKFLSGWNKMQHTITKQLAGRENANQRELFTKDLWCDTLNETFLDSDKDVLGYQFEPLSKTTKGWGTGITYNDLRDNAKKYLGADAFDDSNPYLQSNPDVRQASQDFLRTIQQIDTFKWSGIDWKGKQFAEGYRDRCSYK